MGKIGYVADSKDLRMSGETQIFTYNYPALPIRFPQLLR